jgi:tRNA(His) guanylyltransferase
MNFDAFDAQMRVFEIAHDHQVLPDLYMVARLDGRSFTRLTKEVHSFESPYDERFRDYMCSTTEHLMDCGFRVVYGYTQSDEISLLFHPHENAFNRLLRKYLSVLPGEASARFSLLLGSPASFDCRLAQLPTLERVQDYFLWRMEDAHRNALNAHAFWTLRNDGQGPKEAADALEGMSVSEKNELLFQHGVNYNDLPAWQKRGVGFSWESYEKHARDPRTNQEVLARRFRVKQELELPMKEQYSQMVAALLAAALV